MQVHELHGARCRVLAIDGSTRRSIRISQNNVVSRWWRWRRRSSRVDLREENITSERTIAVPTRFTSPCYVRLRAPPVQERKSRRKILCDATEEHNDGAERTTQNTFLEICRMDGVRLNALGEGAVTLDVDFPNVFESCNCFLSRRGQRILHYKRV